MPERLPSLDLVAEKVRAERDGKARHFESLDTRAGIVLGFAGALVALASGEGALSQAGRVSAALAALLALWSLLPRTNPALNISELRSLYLHSEPPFTKLHLLDTEVVMVERLSRVIARKARRLAASVVALALSIALTAVGILVTRGS